MGKVGKPARYGTRKTHTIRMPDAAWENVKALAKLHQLAGVAELLIMIGTGKLAVVSHDSNDPSKSLDIE